MVARLVRRRARRQLINSIDAEWQGPIRVALEQRRYETPTFTSFTMSGASALYAKKQDVHKPLPIAANTMESARQAERLEPAERFDRFARTLAEATSRRGMLRGLGLTIGVVVGRAALGPLAPVFAEDPPPPPPPPPGCCCNGVNCVTECMGTECCLDCPTVSRAASIEDVTVNELDSGTTDAVFVVTLDGPAPGTRQVSYGTVDGTAIAGTDYEARSGTLSFAFGEQSKEIRVPIIGNTVPQADRAFTVQIAGDGTNITIDRGTATGTIVDDDDALPGLSIADSSRRIPQGRARPMFFTVTLSAASAETVSVTYQTVDGSARAGTHYVAVPPTVLTFAPSETTKQIEVLIKRPRITRQKRFTVVLSAEQNATIVDGVAIGTIRP